MMRAVAGALLLLGACGKVTEPELSVEWRTQPIPLELRTNPPRVVVAGGTGRVTISGDTDLRSCYRTENTARLQGSTLTFEIRHRATGQAPCPGAAEFVKYEAVVRGMDPGAYTVRVEYTTDARVQRNPVVEQVVEVR